MIVSNIQLPYDNQNIKASKGSQGDEGFASTISRLLASVEEEMDIEEPEEITIENFVHPALIVNIPFLESANFEVNIINGESYKQELESQPLPIVTQPNIFEDVMVPEGIETNISDLLPNKGMIPQQIGSDFVDKLREELPTSKTEVYLVPEMKGQDLEVEIQGMNPSNKYISETIEDSVSYMSEEKDIEIVDKDVPISKDKDLKTENKTTFTDLSIGDKEFKQVVRVEGENNIVSRDNIQNISNSIIKLVETTTEGSTSVMKVQLYPEDLGTVDVILKMDEGKITAKIIVESDHIKQMFNNKINELSENMIKQNIQVDKMEIELNTTQNYLNSQSDFSEGFNRESRNHFKRSQMINFKKEALSKRSLDEVSSNSGAISILA